MEEQQEALKQSIRAFLTNESLYEMIPQSGLVLVLEKNLPLLDVIELCLSHKQESAVIWDPDSLSFTGSVDSRDLLKIIISQYREDDMQLEADAILSKLKSQTLNDWRVETSQNSFVYVNSDENLFTASQLLKSNKLHRLPIWDEKQNLVVGIMSMEAILSFFIENYIADSSLFDHPLSLFPIGTANRIITAPVTCSLIEALRVMAEHNLSSLPLVGDTQNLEGVLFLSDIPSIINSGLYLNLDTPILHALKTLNENDDSGMSRFADVDHEDTMKTMIQKLATSPERKLFKRNGSALEMIITESDLFGYFIYN